MAALALILILVLRLEISGCIDTNNNSFIIDFLLDFSDYRNWEALTLINEDQREELLKIVMKKILLNRTNKFSRLLKRIDVGQNRGNKMFEEKPKMKQQFLLFWNSETVEFLEEISKRWYFKRFQEWLIILEENQTLEEVKQLLGDTQFFTDSDVFVVIGRKGTFSVFEIWRVGPNSPALSNQVAEWCSTSNLKFFDDSSKFHRRCDMKGYHLKTVQLSKSNLNIKLHQYVIGIWKILQQQLNFTYSEKALGNYDSLVGQVKSRNADVALGPLFITPERAEIVDFILPVKIYQIRFYMRRPIRRVSWTMYSLPFTTSMWMSVFSFVFLTGSSLWFLNKIATIYIKSVAKKLPFYLAIWDMFSSFVQQSPENDPVSVSCKLVLMVGAVTNLILYTCYSGILVAILTTLKPQLPFTSFEDLRHRPDWTIGANNGTVVLDILKNAPEGSVFRKAWESNMKKENLVSSTEEGLRKALKENYAHMDTYFTIEESLRNFFSEEEAAAIVDTGKDLFWWQLGFGLQKKSPFLALFNHYLAKMTSTGHLHRLSQINFDSFDKPTQTENPSLGLLEVFTVFVCLGTGMAASIIILISEMGIKCIEERNQVNNQERKNIRPFY